MITITSVACAAGKYRSAEMESCEACTGNSFSSGGAGTCTLCEEGSVANEQKTACC